MNRKGSSRKSSRIQLMMMLCSLSVSIGGVVLAHDEYDDEDNNIVTAIVAPPVVTNGIVAGEPTEIIIMLNAPGVNNKLAADPQNFGHQIPAGGRMEVELGGTFERNGVDNTMTGAMISNNLFFVLVTGLPQMPIVAASGTGVQHGDYTIMDDGDKLITIKPNGGSGSNGLVNARANEIGFKIVHIRPRPNTNSGPAPFTNGPAGTKGMVTIRIYNSNNEIVESGIGSVMFPESVGRQIGPTNAGLATGMQGSPVTITAELVESVNFQHVAPDTMLVNTSKSVPFSSGAPYAPRYLMFESLAMQPDSFIPFKGIADVGYIVHDEKPWKASLMQDTNADGVIDGNDERIGKIRIKGPSKKSRGMILPNTELTQSGDGTSGPNGSILNVPVKVGSEPGVYRVVVSLEDGNKTTTTLIVE